ncbi:hypothetical protein [Streptomyces sp. NPDC059378]|uniref:hypothetical protein n=1 Tax=Streptomyces sp. NPDC059378 TaxID=3346815 RepID=UPI003687CA17
MPAGIRWWRRWARQARPRRGTRTCCWYHGGDWHQVNAMALQILTLARAASVNADDIKDFALEHAAAGADPWQTQALSTLFNTAHAIQADSRREARETQKPTSGPSPACPTACGRAPCVRTATARHERPSTASGRPKLRQLERAAGARPLRRLTPRAVPGDQ